MTAPPTPDATHAFVDSRVMKVNREFDEMRKFCIAAKMRGTFLFFGSARAMSQDAFDRALTAATEAVNGATDEAGKVKAEAALAKVKAQAWVPQYWDATRELAKILTEWAKSEEGVRVGNAVPTNFPNSFGEQPLIVCTGGGPGFMEAGNLGASQANGASMGIGVVLPFETNLNPYVTPSLGYTCDTFYTRKYWEVFCAKAMIVCPGGMGTCDEMFEVLTLMQCRKMPKIPVVLLGVEYWTNAVNLRYMADKAMMSHQEIDDLCITDDPRVALSFIVGWLKNEDAGHARPGSP